MRVKPLIVAGGLSVLNACAGTANLVPAGTAHALPGVEAAAVEAVEGVRVVARPDIWPGFVPVQQEVTPIRVAIYNDGDAPLRVQYREFELTTPDGRIFAALPLLEIDTAVREPRAVPPVPVRPAFTANDFEIAPLYAPVYPDLPVGPNLYYDPEYYEYVDYYYDYWRRYDLPTATMIELAIPEGVLLPGGELEGFLYFEEVGTEVPRVSFRMDLVNARNAALLGTIEIPFVVRDE